MNRLVGHSYFLCKEHLQVRMNYNKARLGECMNKFVLVLFESCLANLVQL